MLNVLKKDFLYTYIPGSPGTPGSPYVPAIPPTCTTNTYYLNSWYEKDLFQERWTVYVFDSATSSFSMYFVYSEAEAISILDEYASPRTFTTCTEGTPAIPAVPAIPPTPAQTLISNNTGWNAGAISAVSLVGDGGFLFKISKTTTGAVIGFASPNDGVGTADINHGFYFASSGGLSIMEGGAIKKSGITYSEGNVLRVMRHGGVVTYWVNGVKVMTSATASTGTKYLDVSLYTAGDYVYDPDIFEVISLRGVAAATTRLKLSGALKARGSAVASVQNTAIRNGSNVDLFANNSGVSAATVTQASLRAVKQLSAKGV